MTRPRTLEEATNDLFEYGPKTLKRREPPYEEPLFMTRDEALAASLAAQTRIHESVAESLRQLGRVFEQFAKTMQGFAAALQVGERRSTRRRNNKVRALAAHYERQAARHRQSSAHRGVGL